MDVCGIMLVDAAHQALLRTVGKPIGLFCCYRIAVRGCYLEVEIENIGSEFLDSLLAIT